MDYLGEEAGHFGCCSLGICAQEGGCSFFRVFKRCSRERWCATGTSVDRRQIWMSRIGLGVATEVHRLPAGEEMQKEEQGYTKHGQDQLLTVAAHANLVLLELLVCRYRRASRNTCFAGLQVGRCW